jgi:TetR/AcrR family transcriptional regulator
MPRRKPTPKKTKPGPRGNPEATRAAILDAALHEFASEGVAGARTDAIARAAGVNKALLYYYYQDKEALYGAVLDHVFGGLVKRVTAVLDRELPPREKILAYAAAHFDYIAESPIYPKVVLGEMIRGGRRVSPHIERLVTQYFRPLQARLLEVFRQGMGAGEIRAVEPQHFILSMVAMNVFYFASAVFLKTMMGADPLSPERIATRRAAVLDLLNAALACEGLEDEAARKSKQRGKTR